MSVHSMELCDDNGQRNGFAKGMIGSIRAWDLSLPLLCFSLSTTTQSVDRLRRLQARFSTTVFPSAGMASEMVPAVPLEQVGENN